jgi:hypothetical protein
VPSKLITNGFTPGSSESISIKAVRDPLTVGLKDTVKLVLPVDPSKLSNPEVSKLKSAAWAPDRLTLLMV